MLVLYGLDHLYKLREDMVSNLSLMKNPSRKALKDCFVDRYLRLAEVIVKSYR